MEVTDAGNTAPDANPDSIRLPVGVAGDVPVLANDVDPDGDELTITAVNAPDGVEAERKGQQLHITLGPAAGEREVVHYTINDGDPTHDTIGSVLVLKIDDTSPNRPPVANPDAERVVIGNTVKIAVTANDIDPDRDLIRLLSVGLPADGAGTTVVEGNSVRFTPILPDITEPTPVTFLYTITDGNGHEVTGKVTVTVLVEALPRAPFARDDFADTVQDKSVNIDVLANDSDPSGGKPSLDWTAGVRKRRNCVQDHRQQGDVRSARGPHRHVPLQLRREQRAGFRRRRLDHHHRHRGARRQQRSSAQSSCPAATGQRR